MSDTILPIRLREGKVQTPRVVLEHPEHRRITVVGCAHYGQSSYFQQINACLESHIEAGAQVFLESKENSALWDGVGSDLADEYRAVSANMRLALRRYDFWWQWDAMMDRPDWICDLPSEACMPAVIQFLTEGKDLSAWCREQIVIVRGWLEKPELTLRSYRGRLILAAKASDRLIQAYADSAVLGPRDRFIASSILPVAQSREVSAVYGGAHVPGIIGGLQSAGYCATSTDWFTVLDLVPEELAESD